MRTTINNKQQNSPDGHSGWDACARQFAALLGDVIAQRLSELPAPGPAEPRLLLTVEEAARQLAISRTIGYELLRSGQLESVKLGRIRRIPVGALDEFVTRLREEARG
jgi:excisionase family DNA binding protein